MSYKLVLPDDFDDLAVETEAREYYSLGSVELPSGRRMRMFFVTLKRLTDAAQSELAAGYPCYYEPGIVIVPEATRDAIEKAVADIARNGWFDD